MPIILGAFAAAPAGAFAGDDAPSGKELFSSVEPACSVCHVLRDAGAVGRVGPNLDELQPTPEQVRKALQDGPGAMPAYGERLSEAEIDAVAEYVASAAGT
ncbi:c-type cytochrome [Nitratireductor sp. GCM10026969]